MTETQPIPDPELTKKLRAVRVRIHRMLSAVAGEPADTPIGRHPAVDRIEREFTARGLPELMDTRSILGYCVGRLVAGGAEPEVILEYIAVLCEMLQPMLPAVKASLQKGDSDE